MKAVVIHYDARSKELCIATAPELDMPANALEVVRVGQEELNKLGTTESDKRIAGTIIGLLEVFHQRKIRDGTS